MAHGGRHRALDISRRADGKPHDSRYRHKDGGADFAVIQRIGMTDPAHNEALLRALGDRARINFLLSDRDANVTREDRDRLKAAEALLASMGERKDQHLSYPLGVLFARGDLARKADKNLPPSDGRHDPVEQRAKILHDAGLKYASDHVAFWGGLRQDVAEALTPTDIRELQRTGRTSIQRRKIPTHLERFVAGIVGTEDYQSDSEREKRRAGLSARYAAARRAMGPWVTAVDHITLDELPPRFPADGPSAWHMLPGFRVHLICGLLALAKVYHLAKDLPEPDARGFYLGIDTKVERERFASPDPRTLIKRNWDPLSPGPPLIDFCPAGGDARS